MKAIACPACFSSQPAPVPTTSTTAPAASAAPSRVAADTVNTNDAPTTALSSVTSIRPPTGLTSVTISSEPAGTKARTADAAFAEAVAESSDAALAASDCAEADPEPAISADTSIDIRVFDFIVQFLRYGLSSDALMPRVAESANKTIQNIK